MDKIKKLLYSFRMVLHEAAEIFEGGEYGQLFNLWAGASDEFQELEKEVKRLREIEKWGNRAVAYLEKDKAIEFNSQAYHELKELVEK